MNYRMVIHTVGQVVLLEAGLLILPLLVSLYYGDTCAAAYVQTIAVAAMVGSLMTFAVRPKNHNVFAKEGFSIVSIGWLMLSAIGALPFVFSGDIPSYVDAFFETVSGFTTTGASILTDVEAMQRGNLFWRSFTHWVGGMGVLVLVTIIAEKLPNRSMNILKAEMPGPIVGKLVPKTKDTSRILYLIYFAMTVLVVVLLLLGGMPLFDSILHAFGTAGTGGFGIKADSIAGYSPYLQWVITLGMLAFGVNFNIYFLLLLRRFGEALRSTELWTYLGIVSASVLAITVNIASMYASIGESLRHAAFQVSSIITTTGYATTDFDLWPEFSKAILLLLMFMGACAGSTGGGLKVSRVVILGQMIWAEIRRMVHPRAVSVVRYEGKVVDKETQTGTATYFALYCLCMVVAFLLVSLEPFSMETNLSATVACFNNIGPGFDVVGPTGSFAQYSDFSKIVLSFAMLLGRLEVVPLLLTFIPSAWHRR